MTGDDFINSKWCKEAESPETQNEIKKNFGNWSKRVNNTGILSRAKQLFQFFLSEKITGTQKIVVTGALLYIISPIDLIPDFIPVIGWLDDIGVAGFALSYIFSQMDALSELDSANFKETTNKTNEIEIMENVIPGTEGTIIDVLPDKSVKNFNIPIDNKSSLKLQQKLSELSEIANKLQIDDSTNYVTLMENRIAGLSFQKIAVVGRYSTGKSTLINSLLEKELLPVSVIPTTKALTYVMQGNLDALYSENRNGDITVHDSLSELRELYQDEVDPPNKISITLTDFPFENLTIIDTPGLEEPDKTVVHLTLDILPETDAIIVLLDANYMESRVEFDFISSLLKKDREKKLFIVINKIDGKTADEIQTLKKLCLSHLIEIGITMPNIYLVAAKEGMQDLGLSQFKSELFQFLNTGIKAKAQTQLETELKTFAQSLFDSCTNAMSNAKQDIRNQQNNSLAVAEKITNITATYNEQKRMIVRKFQAYKSQFFLEFSVFIDTLKANVRQEILGAKLDTLKNTDAIALKIKEQIVDFVDGKINEINEKIQADLHSSQDEIRAFLINLDLPIEVEVKDYSGYASIFLPVVVATSYVFCGFFSFLWILIGAIAGRNFFESAISKLMSKVGINLVRDKISEQVADNLDKGKIQLNAKFNEAFEAMENELILSFDNACGKAITPLKLIGEDKNHPIEEIDTCRERLASIIS